MEKEKLKIGIIGVGYWGPNLVRNFIKHPDSVVKIVADLKPGRLEFIKGQYENIQLTQDMNDILSDKEIDAVIIATPVNTHKEIAIKALKSGKHILVEKPFTDNYNDGLEIMNLSRQKKLICAVGHIFQFSPAVTAMKNEIDKGILGSFYHYTSQRINLGPPATSVDVIWDLAPHDLSILLYLFGDYPEKISAYGNSYWWNEFIDNAHIFLEFPGNKTAHIHVSWLSSNKTRLTSIFGERGNIVYDETKPDDEKVIFYDKGVDNRINAKDNEVKNLAYGKGEVKNIKFEAGEPLFNEVNAFIKAIRTGINPVNDAKIGCEVVRILEEASKSILNKKT